MLSQARLNVIHRGLFVLDVGVEAWLLDRGKSVYHLSGAGLTWHGYRQWEPNLTRQAVGYEAKANLV